MMNFEQAREAVRYAHSYNRANIILDLYEQMQRSDWLRILCDEWESTDNLSTLRHRFKNALGSQGPLLEMMTPGEQLRYDALPLEVTVYRGCSIFDKRAGGIHGMSWTLSLEVAKKFPTLKRYMVSYPVVYRANVKKSRVLAVKLSRDEEELITFGPYKGLQYIRIPRSPGLTVDPEEWWGKGNLFKEMMDWGRRSQTTF
jgi:hypothetical protein